MGYQALLNSTGSDNTAFGLNALVANTTGTRNTAIGQAAGSNITTGSYNVSIGNGCNTATTANGNVAVGDAVLANNTTGASNVAIGSFDGGTLPALYYNTTGASNVAVGTGAYRSNTTGSNNVAVGYQAGSQNTTASNNTAVGYQAGYSNTTGLSNVFVGESAGYNSTANGNTFVGQDAGFNVTSGANNTIIGGYNGNQNGLDIRTASNYIVLSDGDGKIGFIANGSATNGRYIQNDGSQLLPGTDNVLGLGAASYRWTTVYATTGTINTSDVNQKQDIASLDDAEKRVAVAIKSLIKKYRFKDAVAQKGDAARIHVGAVAQEVQAAFVAEGLDPARYALFCSDTWYEVDGKAKGKDLVHYTEDTPNSIKVTRLGLRYEELLAFVIAAL
jgi:hypothetical protein